MVNIPGLSQLPLELLLIIIDELDEADLCALGCVCKSLNSTVFPFFFDKYKLVGALQGTIQIYWRPLKHCLRAVRCCVSILDIRAIHYPFTAGLETLVEELGNMNAIVQRARMVNDFMVDFQYLDAWTLLEPDSGSHTAAKSLLKTFTTIEWTKRYGRILGTTLSRGCKKLEIRGGGNFFNYLRKCEENIGSNTQTGSWNGSPGIFEGVFWVESPDTSQPKRRSRRNANAASIGQKQEAPVPQLRTLALRSDMMLLQDSMFLDWTIRLLSWCAPTLIHLEIHCPKTPSVAWHRFFSEISLPSLSHFQIGDSDVHPSNILRFLARHPTIRTLRLLHRAQDSTSPHPGPLPKPVLPRLQSVTLQPTSVRWLSRNKKQCPELKAVALLTADRLDSSPFDYELLDQALRDLLPYSRQLQSITLFLSQGFQALDSWLQSHVNSSKPSLLSKFTGVKTLQLDSDHAQGTNLISRSRLELVGRFVGLFPSLEYLELKNQTGAPHDKGDYIPPVVDALREYCPQLKRFQINWKPVVHISPSVG